MSNFIILLTFVFTFPSAHLMGMLGPANFVYQSAEQCPDAPRIVIGEVAARRIDRNNFGIDIQVDSPYDFDDKLGLVMVGSQKLDGGYKEGAFFWNSSNLCESFKTLMGEVFDDMQEQANIDGCPIPKGHYEIKNFIFDNDKFNVPHVYGDYRMEFRSTRDGVDLSCILIYYDLVPKNNLG